MSNTLHDAVMSFDLYGLNIHIKSGVDINKKDEKGRTALHISSWLGYEDFSAKLIAFI